MILLLPITVSIKKRCARDLLIITKTWQPSAANGLAWLGHKVEHSAAGEFQRFSRGIQEREIEKMGSGHWYSIAKFAPAYLSSFERGNFSRILPRMPKSPAMAAYISQK